MSCSSKGLQKKLFTPLSMEHLYSPLLSYVLLNFKCSHFCFKTEKPFPRYITLNENKIIFQESTYILSKKKDEEKM